MTLDLGRIDQDSVSLEVSKRILGLLASGKIPPGSRLPSERDLSLQLGVGRNAIRDGLRPLALLGIVEARPGSGTYVKNTTSELLPQIIEWGLLLGEPSVHELVEARLFIEAGLSRLAAERRDAATVRSLRSLLNKMHASRTHEEFMKADLAFHMRIADAAGNDVLAGMLRNIRTLITVWIRRVVTAERDLGELYGEHVAIFDAIEARDLAAAGTQMERHLTIVRQRLEAGLEAERQSESASGAAPAS